MLRASGEFESSSRRGRGTSCRLRSRGAVLVLCSVSILHRPQEGPCTTIFADAAATAEADETNLGGAGTTPTAGGGGVLRGGSSATPSSRYNTNRNNQVQPQENRAQQEQEDGAETSTDHALAEVGKLGGEGRPSGWVQRSPAAGAAQGSPSAAAGSAAPATEAGPGVAAARPPPTTIAPGPPSVATSAEVVPGWAQTLPPPWLSAFFPQNCPGRVLVPGDKHNLTLLIYHFEGLVLEEKQNALVRQAQVPAPVLAQGQSQADAAGGASATVPATTPKPAPLTEQDRKDIEHWAENLAANTTIEDVAAGLEHLVKKFTVPEEYQHLCPKSFSQNKMKQICGASACEKPKGQPDADYIYDPVCLEKYLRVSFKHQIVAQGLGKEDSRCVPVPSDSGYIQARPDLKNIGPLPDFLKSQAEFRSYFNKKGKYGAGPWATWDDLRKQVCNSNLGNRCRRTQSLGFDSGSEAWACSGDLSAAPGATTPQSGQNIPVEQNSAQQEVVAGPGPSSPSAQQPVAQVTPAPVVAQGQTSSQAGAAGGTSATVPSTPKPPLLTDQDRKAAFHWAENLAAETTIETMAANLENLVEKFTIPEEYQHLCAVSAANRNRMKLICGSSACEKWPSSATYKYDPGCLEKWLRAVFRDQILSQGLGKAHSRCVPVPTRDEWDHFPDFALPDFVKGKKSKSKKGLLQYLEKADGTGAGPWRTWGDMRNQLCGNPHGAFDCVPSGEHSPDPGTGEGYDWEPLPEKEYLCYEHEFGYDPHAVKFKEAASHWTKNLAASTTIETMAAKMENLVEAFTLPEQYQHACKDNVRTLSMELICGPSACEKPKGKPDADYKYDAACLEKWLRMELRDQILAQGLGKTNSRCVPVPTRDDWDHFPDFALPDFVKGKNELLRYRDKKDGTGAGPWRTWGDMRNQLCGDPHDAFDCVPLGEDSPNPGTGEGYDWEPLEKEHRCYRQEFGYDPHVYLR